MVSQPSVQREEPTSRTLLGCSVPSRFMPGSSVVCTRVAVLSITWAYAAPASPITVSQSAFI